MYTGHYCQYKLECNSDADCNDKGKCIEVDPNGLYKPSKQCFCEAGRMGLNCEKESSIKDKAFNAEDYSRLVLTQ